MDHSVNGFQVNGGFQVIIEIHLATIWEGFAGITSSCNVTAWLFVKYLKTNYFLLQVFIFCDEIRMIRFLLHHNTVSVTKNQSMFSAYSKANLVLAITPWTCIESHKMDEFDHICLVATTILCLTHALISTIFTYICAYIYTNICMYTSITSSCMPKPSRRLVEF